MDSDEETEKEADSYLENRQVKMLSFDVIISSVSWGKDHAAFVTSNGLYTFGRVWDSTF